MVTGIISAGTFLLGPSWLSRALLAAAAAGLAVLSAALAVRLAGLAAAVRLVLTYGVPASLLLTRERDPVLGGANGAWLLWVVGAQSLSVAGPRR